MKKTVKDTIISFLLLSALVLLIFCPIFSMKVELNDGITKSICNVSIFTALSSSTIHIDNFNYTLQATIWAIILIVLLQCIGLIFTNMKKSYIIGIVAVIISWILLLTLSLIVITVQSDLFNQYGAVQQQSISAFVIFIMLPELVLMVFNGFIHFRKYKNN